MNTDDLINNIVQNAIPYEIDLIDTMLLSDDLGIDSYKCVEIIISIEDELGIEFSLSSLNIDDLKTLADLKKVTKEEAIRNNAL